MNLRLPTGRRAGGALLGFGVAGIALLLAAAVLVLGSLSAVDDAVTGFERQRAELVGLIEPTSRALADAADAASRAGASLTQASDAAERAAGLTTSLASSFDGLATLGAFEILGARPFAGLSDNFLSVGADARALTTSLQSTAASMRTNAADSAAVSADLRSIATRLEALGTSVAEPTALGASLGLARVILLGLLVWLAIPAILSAWLGWRVFRSSPA